MPDPARGCVDVQAFLVYSVFDQCIAIEDLGDMGTDTNDTTDTNGTSSNDTLEVEPRNKIKSATPREGWYV